MSDDTTQTSTSTGSTGQTTGPVPPADGSTIDLRNIDISGSAAAAPAPVLAADASGLPPEMASTSPIAEVSTSTPVAAPSSDALATPVVDPKIAAEFGLDADQLADVAQKYTIPESVKDKFPDLVALLIKTESMNDEERDYWFQVMPVMTEDQIVKLRTILVNEHEQLKKIDDEYDEEMKKLNDVHKSEWNAFEAQQKKAALVQAETAHEEDEKTKEEDLLKKLEEIDAAQ